ncbi:MAG: glycosyl hydrolase [Armatimonadetes bacterium]|nr:glycosyl hydrolase [Armatimonadota bacterium]
MIRIDEGLTPSSLREPIRRMWELSAAKIAALDARRQPGDGAPVFTCEGRYTSRGWTEWTQGFCFGSMILQFDATGDEAMLDLGRHRIRSLMAPHVTHMGVHDHGFNNISTYGALWRLMNEKRIKEEEYLRDFLEMALACSGAVQARRWTETRDVGGFIYSFNGPHSLFSDTIRSLRSLAVAHLLGHVLMEERDTPVSLLQRLADHAIATVKYNVYYGEGRDAYDVPGRVAHEGVFNVNDGSYRCPSTQQGYSPFSTWTRGLAWVLLGCAEQLEFLDALPEEQFEALGVLPPCPGAAPDAGARDTLAAWLERAALATAERVIRSSTADGVMPWDTGAPGLARMPGWDQRDSDPTGACEPFDSSASAIAAQGLVRLGVRRSAQGHADGARFLAAGLTVTKTLLGPAYLAPEGHEGLLLHSVYHRPNGWDHIPEGRGIPCGESSMWGDYHLRELALLLQRMDQGGPYLTFFGLARPMGR